MNRKAIDQKVIDASVAFVIEELKKRIEEKGNLAFSSIHECSGVIDEEIRELHLTIDENDHEKFVQECADVAVATIWSIASYHSDSLDW